MTDYVTVKISGTFPADDISILSSFYGIGTSIMGNAVELTLEEKLQALVEMAQARLADFLSMPAKQAAQISSADALRTVVSAIDERVKSALQSEITTTEV